jgi:hypothetical protein
VAKATIERFSQEKTTDLGKDSTSSRPRRFSCLGQWSVRSVTDGLHLPSSRAGYDAVEPATFAFIAPREKTENVCHPSVSRWPKDYGPSSLQINPRKKNLSGPNGTEPCCPRVLITGRSEGPLDHRTAENELGSTANGLSMRAARNRCAVGLSFLSLAASLSFPGASQERPIIYEIF